MHIHILGICGTFMGSLALLAKELGHTVSGSDQNVYPPMSTQLEEQGIKLYEGYAKEHLTAKYDLVIIGNALSRGNPAVEHVMREGIRYTSGPQFLSDHVLPGKWVLAVAGTHGKTTTSSILAWILEFAGMKPGYLIGGVTKNLPVSATLGDSDFFVVEADEYDTAFFDKRSKFIHYLPRTLVLNNLEFDHADIFPDLNAIKLQFHHLIRTIPDNGLILHHHTEENITQVLAKGCWTPTQLMGMDLEETECEKLATTEGVFWNARLIKADGSEFEVVKYGQGSKGKAVNRALVQWDMLGRHNVANFMAACAAAHHVGVGLASAAAAMQDFAGVKRRLELRGEVAGVKVYDDFAHHPTAIASTLEGMATRLGTMDGAHRLIAIIDPRSNTMRTGIHQDTLNESCSAADMIIWHQPDDAWLDFKALVANSESPAYAFPTVGEIVQFLEVNCIPGDHVVIMSNGGFDGIHEKLLCALGHPSIQ